KKVLMVVNNIDILDSEAERVKVLTYVQEHARETLGVTPEVFGVSAKRAFQARLSGDEEALEASGLTALEAAVRARLGRERLRLKLSSPLGVANRTAETYADVLKARRALLGDDAETLEEIERQRAQFDKDLRREFEGHVARIQAVLHEVERRGEAFFDDTIRLRRLMKLVNTERVREEFEKGVLKDADREIDDALAQLVDWFIQRNLQLWEDVMSYVNERRAAERDRVIGEVGGRFQYDRQALVRSLRERSDATMDTYDADAEGAQLADR